MSTHTTRFITGFAEEILANFRVMIINGARQSGKTTLLEQLSKDHGGTYRSLDADAYLEAALTDAPAFVATGARPLLIDEVQRGGDPLVLAVKVAVDTDGSKGQFVLAGSTRFLSTPSLTESLAGRAVIVEIWPLAEQEIAGNRPGFLDVAFADPEAFRGSEPSTVTRASYFERICRGGFPEAMSISTGRLRAEWFDTYLQSVVEADIREMARIDEPGNFRRVLGTLAAATAQEIIQSRIAGDLELHRDTVARYLNLLDTVFLTHELPVWSRNLTARAVKRPKIHLTDTGLAAHLMGVDETALADVISPSRGALVETFIANELAKQRTWSDRWIRLHHWRVSGGAEVDIVAESGGRVVGVEAKANSTVRRDDFRGLIALRDAIGDDFVHGYVMYTGPNYLSFGDRMTAVPISALWEAGR